MEEFLLEGAVTKEELNAVIPKAMAAGTVIPICCRAAKKGIGVPELLEALSQFAPSPVEGKKRTATQGSGEKAKEITLEPSESSEFAGQVFKTLTDKFVGNLSFIRVYSGKIAGDQPLFNARTDKSSRTSGLLLIQCKTQKTDSVALYLRL